MRRQVDPWSLQRVDVDEESFTTSLLGDGDGGVMDMRGGLAAPAHNHVAAS